ncbi:unnamed protein product [Camellia sinensis]
MCDSTHLNYENLPSCKSKATPLAEITRCSVSRSERRDYNLGTCPDLPRQTLLKSRLAQRGSIEPTPSAD